MTLERDAWGLELSDRRDVAERTSVEAGPLIDSHKLRVLRNGSNCVRCAKGFSP
jgi:hypothetical protein